MSFLPAAHHGLHTELQRPMVSVAGIAEIIGGCRQFSNEAGNRRYDQAVTYLSG